MVATCQGWLLAASHLGSLLGIDCRLCQTGEDLCKQVDVGEAHCYPLAVLSEHIAEATPSNA